MSEQNLKVGTKINWKGKIWKVVGEDRQSKPLRKMWDIILRTEDDMEEKRIFESRMGTYEVIE